MSKRFSLALAAIVVVVGGAVAAVLVVSDDGSSSPTASQVSVEHIQLAASNTEAAESMQFDLHSSGDLGVRASGVISGDGQQGQTSVTLGKFGDIEQRIVDGTVYIKPSSLLGRSGDGWYSISSDRLRDLGRSFGAGSAFDGTPTSALDALDKIAGPVETVGDDTVGGRHATHYRVTVDAEGDATSVDVWIDDHDRVVKVQGSVPDGGDVTLEVTAFGVPVDVQAPPADQVTELPSLSGMLGADAI